MTAAVARPAAAAPVALDRVMLAMDVVDTLRHRRELVARELDDDSRQRELVERVQAIYDAQGIEVSESVIAEGVRALREGRFTYAAPPRTFAVRLAEVYVERGRWALRVAVLIAVVLAIWSAFAIPAHYRERTLVASFAQHEARLDAEHEDLGALARAVRDRLAAATAAAATPAARRLLGDADTALAAAAAAVAALAAGRAGLPDAEAYPDDLARWNEVLAALDARVAVARAELGTANGLLGAVQLLGTLRLQLGTVLARLDGVEPTAAERADLAALQQEVEAAIDAGDSAAGRAALRALDARIDELLVARRRQDELRARLRQLGATLAGVDVEVAAVGELERRRTAVEQAVQAGDWARADDQMRPYAALVAELDQVYELRILARPNVQSGVWRYRDDNRRQRNFYVIVEAIGPDGAPVQLPITNEETQRIVRTSRFGVRVPEQVYELVKADKLDNGLIDNASFGSKRRGARTIEYRLPVAGGHLTEW